MDENTSKKPFFKTPLGIIVAVIFFPITLTYLIWKRTNWNPIIKVVLIVLIWMFVFAKSDTSKAKNKAQIATNEKKNEVISTLSPTNSPTQKPTSSPTKEPTKKPEPTKEIKKEDAESILMKIAKKYSSTEPVILKEKDGWTVTLIKELKEDFAMFSISKQVARDFIFETYATGIPIKHASISINYYSGGKAYSAGLGNDVASSQPSTTWTDKGIGPTIFYDFLKKYTNGAPGDGQFSTYVETNLD